jgi:dihydroneopterin aldolase
VRSAKDDMEEVPSYTDIIDGVNAITSEGHINLLETFAERIAKHCLKDERIVSVRVRIEKLERGPVRGVDIARARVGGS